MEKEEKKKNKKREEKKEVDKLKECEKERDEYIQLSQRLKADFLNLKKDNEQQLKKIKDIANEHLILEILPVLDSLQLALKHTPEELKDNNWVVGMLGIKGQLESALKSVGLKEISAVGEKFDPNLHEALEQEESDKEEGIVLEEIQKGYMLNDKVIRAVKVKVSK